MKYSKIYQMWKLIAHNNNHYYEICRSNIKLYQFNFPEQKRTIKIINKYVLETIPPFSILLPSVFINSDVCILMGTIKDNKLFGMEINGYKPWICGEPFQKRYSNPENDIINVINDLWQTNFPYYSIDKLNKNRYLNLNDFKELT